MNLNAFKSAAWQYKKGTAQLFHNHSALITIKFGGRISDLSLQDRSLQIRKSGFWYPEFTIFDRGNVLVKQTPIGLWGYKHEVRIGDRIYLVRSKASFHYRVLCTNSQGKEVVSYHLNAWKWKPPVEFQFDETAAPATDIPFLLILGYLTLRKLKQDSDGAAIVAVTG
jgi:hypothetical protein